LFSSFQALERKRDQIRLGRVTLPVLVEPVVGLGLGVERVAEVGGAGGGHPVHGAVVKLEVVDELLVTALVVLLHDAEVSGWRGSHFKHR